MLAEEPDFSAAMLRYYDDVIAFQKASQIVPSFMRSQVAVSHLTRTFTNIDRYVYSWITNGGHALNVLFARLHLAIDPTQDGWKEDEGLKSVTALSTLREYQVC